MRRRRAAKEIAFSFDSFLDLVANVVGIILRLILVAWMGARTYKAFAPPRGASPQARRRLAPGCRVAGGSGHGAAVAT